MKNLVKSLLVLPLLTLAAAPATAQDAPAATPPASLMKQATERATGQRVGIAVTVNDDVITFSDIENRMRLYLMGAPGVPPEEVQKQLMAQVINKLVDEKLQLQEARSLGIVVDQAQLDEAFAGIAAQNKLTAEEFKKALRAHGVEPATLMDQTQAEIAWVQVVRRRLRPQIVISENEIDGEIDRLSRVRGQTEYRVAEIFLAVNGPGAEPDAYRLARELQQRIQQGAPFSQIAREYSQAPGAATGGDRGWLVQGLQAPEIETALKSMQPGQLSDPIRTERGLHLIFLRDVRQIGGAGDAAAPAKPLNPTPVTPEMAKPAAAPQAADDAAADTTASAAEATPPTLVHLKQIALHVPQGEPAVLTNVKTARAAELAREIKTCADMDARMKDYAGAGTGDMGTGPQDRLPDAIRSVVEQLPAGGISQPIRTADSVLIVMVCARHEPQARPAVAAAAQPAPQAAAPAATPAPTPAPAPAGEASRDDIAQRLGSKRLEQMAERYLRDLRATAFIDRRF